MKAMKKHLLGYVLVAAISVLLTAYLEPFKHLPVLAQTGGQCQTFQETGKTVCGRFLEYWQKNGGLPQQGYPLSNEFTETSDLDGKPYTVQYFERAVFERHPENKPPYDVLLSQLGTFRFKQKYPGGEPGAPTATPAPPPGVGSVVTLEDGVTLEFLKADIRPGCQIPAELYANFRVKSTRTVPFTFRVDKDSVVAQDSTGKSYPQTCLGGDQVNASFGQAPEGHTLTKNQEYTRELGFNITGLAAGTAYVDISFKLNGRALVFRYTIK